MLSHVTSCHVMSRHVTSCHVMSCHVTSCHVTGPDTSSFNSRYSSKHQLQWIAFRQATDGRMSCDVTDVTVWWHARDKSAHVWWQQCNTYCTNDRLTTVIESDIRLLNSSRVIIKLLFLCVSDGSAQQQRRVSGRYVTLLSSLFSSNDVIVSLT